MADNTKGRGTELASLLNGLGASAFYLASAILLIVSSALTIANTQKGFAITGTVSGACLIVRHPFIIRPEECHSTTDTQVLVSSYLLLFRLAEPLHY
jgi:hypothetical protein